MGIAVSRTLSPHPHRPRVAVMGDSQDLDAIFNGATNKAWNSWGHAAELRIQTGHRFHMNLADVVAVSGHKSADVLATQVPLVLAMNPRPDLVLLKVGTNDLPTVPVATTTANIAQIFDTLNSYGIPVLVTTVIPRGTGSMFTADVRKSHAHLNRWLWQQARDTTRRVYFADPTPDMLDYSTGSGVTALYWDHVHTNSRGGYQMAKAAAAVVNNLFPPVQWLPAYIADTYDATYNPSGNLVTNGMLTGTAGTLTNGAAGTAPTSWTLTRSNAAGTTTVTGSLDTLAGYTNLNRCVLTLGGTGDGTIVSLTQSLNAANFAVGDQIYAVCAYDVESVPAGVSPLTLNFSFVNSTPATVTYKDGNATDAMGPMAPVTMSERILVTPTATLTTGFTSPTITLSCIGITGTSPSAAIKIRQVGVFKV